jgi:hypothetical protein
MLESLMPFHDWAQHVAIALLAADIEPRGALTLSACKAPLLSTDARARDNRYRLSFAWQSAIYWKGVVFEWKIRGRTKQI